MSRASNNAEAKFFMMFLAGVCVIGVPLTILSIYAFPKPNKKKDSE
jgi:hypothetical protein